MAMTPNGMASAIISSISQSDNASDANSKFYKALCEYVEGNAEVYYSWSAALTSPPFTPDPMVVIKATIKTTGSLSPNGATTCEAALAQFSADLNRNAAMWSIVWPAGFTLTPAFVIPTINITPSMATEQQSAMLAVCTQIIAGIKQATPTASGSHISFVGIASFTQII
jgi:hypothetical protein